MAVVNSRKNVCLMGSLNANEGAVLAFHGISVGPSIGDVRLGYGHALAVLDTQKEAMPSKKATKI